MSSEKIFDIFKDVNLIEVAFTSKDLNIEQNELGKALRDPEFIRNDLFTPIYASLALFIDKDVYDLTFSTITPGMIPEEDFFDFAEMSEKNITLHWEIYLEENKFCSSEHIRLELLKALKRNNFNNCLDTFIKRLEK
jgi:hypothetical protein